MIAIDGRLDALSNASNRPSIGDIAIAISQPSIDWLPLDGSLYNISDLIELSAVLPANYKINPSIIKLIAESGNIPKWIYAGQNITINAIPVQVESYIYSVASLGGPGGKWHDGGTLVGGGGLIDGSWAVYSAVDTPVYALTAATVNIDLTILGGVRKISKIEVYSNSYTFGPPNNPNSLYISFSSDKGGTFSPPVLIANFAQITGGGSYPAIHEWLDFSPPILADIIRVIANNTANDPVVNYALISNIKIT